MNVVAQGQPQHPNRIDFGHYHPPPLPVSDTDVTRFQAFQAPSVTQHPAQDLAAPHMYHNVGNNNYARVIHAQAQVISPPVPVCNILPLSRIPISICPSPQEIQEHDIFRNVAQHPPVGIPPSDLNACPHGVPVPGEPAAEILRQLASRYLDHPNSQVDTVRVELIPAGGGFRVIIALEIQVGALL